MYGCWENIINFWEFYSLRFVDFQKNKEIFSYLFFLVYFQNIRTINILNHGIQLYWVHLSETFMFFIFSNNEKSKIDLKQPNCWILFIGFASGYFFNKKDLANPIIIHEQVLLTIVHSLLFFLHFSFLECNSLS